MSTSNVVDFQERLDEKNETWDEEFVKYSMTALVEYFVEEWDFTDADDSVEKFAQDMAVVREYLLAVVKRLNGEEHELHEYMDSMFDIEFLDEDGNSAEITSSSEEIESMIFEE